ncbi:unnamed protein product [Diatraea saccharalis]|uniref:Uncharacterized protein n=1 Tax=Diatraea saccharalis TaxID=40085 RepID=A0A9N9R3W4_9NEOP|nr:unnamed protein product [Diatraea saccharalis]
MKQNKTTNNSFVSENYSKNLPTNEETVEVKKSQANCNNNKEPTFVIVESESISNPSSKEILVEDSIHHKDTVSTKYFNTYLRNSSVPSTSKESSTQNQNIKVSESKEEVEMVNINFESENDISITDSDTDNESIVLAYIRNRDEVIELESTLLASKRKTSLLESVPKMETIVEGQRFSTLLTISKNILSQNHSSSTEQVLKDEDI